MLVRVHGRLAGRKRAMKRRPRTTITTVVFDLDDTLYDCYRQRVLRAHHHACHALLPKLRDAGLAVAFGPLLRARLKLFHETRDLENLDRRLCVRLGLRGRRAARLARIGREAYFNLPVGRLQLFPETRPTLRRLHRRGVRIFIITAGRPAVQRQKVRALGLDRSPTISGIYYVPLPSGQSGKQRELAAILRWEADPARILVVGDRPNREIQAANELGMISVRRRGGEFAGYEPKTRKEKARFTIRRLPEIFRLGLRFGH
ncbi:MAG: HAD family hydrolase [Terriglobia bacterium]